MPYPKLEKRKLKLQRYHFLRKTLEKGKHENTSYCKRVKKQALAYIASKANARCNLFVNLAISNKITHPFTF